MGKSNQTQVLPWWQEAFKNWYKFPWIETFITCGIAIFAYIGWLFISLAVKAPPEAANSTFYISAWVSGFFFISLGIGFLGTLCGIGGGVLWSPIAMAFTPMDSVIIRGSGLIVAMFNGLVASGPLMKRGVGNIKLVLFTLVAYGLGAFSGAQGAIYVAKVFGPAGEGIIRILLSMIVCIVGLYFIFGGAKLEYPEVKEEDRFTKFFRIPIPYYEESIGRVLDYKLHRGLLCWIVIFLVGLIGGFFGMGGGWAITPALNFIMGAPLKVAASASMTMLGMGDCIAVWPYFNAGAMIPLIVAPLMAGQVVGGILGAYVLIGMRAVFIRYLLIGVLFFTAFGLFTKGADLLGWFKTPLWLRLGFGLVCVAIVIALIKKDKK